MDRAKFNRLYLNLILFIIIFAFIGIILISDNRSREGAFRIGAGDGFASSIVNKVLDSESFDFDIETYYIQDC
ncbi:MAG: hypothetical protein Q4E02_04110 [Lagierella massiliensis]|nr:hypothetical protein [Lagierella massiliensis]